MKKIKFLIIRILERKLNKLTNEFSDKESYVSWDDIKDCELCIYDTYIRYLKERISSIKRNLETAR